jgi:hypothetical protein
MIVAMATTFCKWLIEELTKKGVDCDKEPGQEDFGWYFNFCRKQSGLLPGMRFSPKRRARKNFS